MDNKIPFEKFARKVGVSRTRTMYLGKLSKEAKDKFDFNDWEGIYTKVVRFYEKDKYRERLLKIILKKMLDKAKDVEETLLAYQETKKGSPEEKEALEKLAAFKYPEDWIAMFDKESNVFIDEKGLNYLKGKVESLIDFP
ncbi:MAG TPA: hypothetical protein PLB52_00385 [Candidatus Moranbacteria bacterium]|nr:hypothetical protein [Candidatus Moranbacteria bacterium]